MLPLVPAPVFRSMNIARQRKAGLRPPWTPRGRRKGVQQKTSGEIRSTPPYTENDVNTLHRKRCKEGGGPDGFSGSPPSPKKERMTNIYRIYRIYKRVIDVAHNALEHYHLCPFSHARLFKNIETTRVPLSHKTRNQSARSMLAYVSNSA